MIPDDAPDTHPQRAPERFSTLGLGAALAVAAVCAWPAAALLDGRLLADAPAASRALLSGDGLVSDGVAVWRGFRPLASGALSLDGPAGALVRLGLWLLAVALSYGGARRLGAGVAGAALAATLLAAHPAAAAAFGEPAGQGALFAVVGLAGAVYFGLAPRRRPWEAAIAAALAAAGALAHPLAALAPVALFAWWAARRTPPWRAGLTAVGVAAIAALAASAAAGADTPPGVAGGGLAHLAAAGEHARLAIVGLPLAQASDPDAFAAVDLGDSRVFIGAFALAGLLALATRMRRWPGARVGAWLAFAALLSLAQPAWALGAPLAPAAALIVSLGLAWIVAAVTPARFPWLGPAVGAGLVALALATERPIAWYQTEAARDAQAADAPATAVPPEALARDRLLAGRPAEAMALLDGRKGAAARRLRLRARLGRGRWTEAERAQREAVPAERDALACALAAARRDVNAVSRCEAAAERHPDDPWIVVDLARALADEEREGAAEAHLRQLVERRGDALAHGALVTHLERAGHVPEAIAALDAWRPSAPAPAAIDDRLVDLLWRKTRGDLAAGRAEEALEAARRGIALDPSHHPLRFGLADALEATGEAEAARAERALAEQAGAPAPPPREPGGGPAPPRAP